ncbi:SMI1/KNR4 family protein [Streptomyces vinaceus]|uniref:SMI1/KNR4 family protein n=1 Tax=Streptomyces vinaceus TaxID=1960 RepID=UPI0038292346
MDDLREAWGQVKGWFDRHAPLTAAALGSPARPEDVTRAEANLGVQFPQVLTAWLLACDVGSGGRPGERSSLVSLGCDGVIPTGGLLLGLTDIQRVYLHHMGLEEMEPSNPECPAWRADWLPIVSESDGFFGKFLDVRDGSIGSWSEGYNPEEGNFPSLADFFRHVMQCLIDVSSGDSPNGRISGGRLVWD